MQASRSLPAVVCRVWSAPPTESSFALPPPHARKNGKARSRSSGHRSQAPESCPSHAMPQSCRPNKQMFNGCAIAAPRLPTWPSRPHRAVSMNGPKVRTSGNETVRLRRRQPGPPAAATGSLDLDLDISVQSDDTASRPSDQTGHTSSCLHRSTVSHSSSVKLRPWTHDCKYLAIMRGRAAPDGGSPI